MSDEAPDDDIYSATYVLFFLNRLLGTAPFILTKSPDRRYHLKFYCFIVGIAHVSSYTVHFWQSVTSIDKNGPIENLKMLSDTFLGSLSTIFIICAIFRSQPLLEGFKLLKCIDDMMKNLGLLLHYRQVRKRVWLQLFGVLVLFVFIGYISSGIFKVIAKHRPDIKILISFSSMLLIVLVEIQYNTYIHVAFLRFETVNKYLETFNIQRNTFCAPKKNKARKNKKISDRVAKSVTVHNPLYILETISDIHIQLTDMCTLFNQAFSIQLLFKVGASFISVVFCLFYAITAFKYSYTYDNGFDMVWIVMLLTAVFYLLELYALVSVSDKTSREAKNCPLLLHKIKHSCTDPDILNAIELYSIQMYHNKLQLTVCRLFPIDHTLLYTMTGAVTTYLIFLVQFSTSSKFNFGLMNEPNKTDNTLI